MALFEVPVNFEMLDIDIGFVPILSLLEQHEPRYPKRTRGLTRKKQGIS